MPQPRSIPLWAGRSVALVGILLVALSLRSAVAALSPILDHVSAEIPLSAVVIGVIGAAPPVMFAASGLLAPSISRRLGLERSMLAAVVVMVIGHFARAVAPNDVVLILATAVTLIGIGVGNVLLPPIVKRYFPDRIGLVTTLYATLLSVSAAVPALIAVPVADALGWRVSLGIWCFVAATAIAPWVTLTVRHRRELARLRTDDSDAVIETESALEGRLWRSPVAWSVTITFAVSSINAYAAFAWLPSLLIATAGVSPAGAGALLSLYAIMGFPAGIVLPLLASRMKNVGLLVFAGVGFFLVGYSGLLFAPRAVPILWVALIGLGPLLFPLALVLINSRTRTHAGSVALSGFVQGIGYVLGAFGPLLVGILKQATGGWSVPILFLVAVSLCGVIAGLLLTRPRFVEDDLAGR